MLGHLTTMPAWERARRLGSYLADSLHSEGFIHLSRDAQLLLAANTHYRGRSDLVVLVVDEARLEEGSLIDEAGSPPNDHLIFPHLYGPLPVDVVIAVLPFPCGADGTFRWLDHLGPEPDGHGAA